MVNAIYVEQAKERSKTPLTKEDRIKKSRGVKYNMFGEYTKEECREFERNPLNRERLIVSAYDVVLSIVRTNAWKLRGSYTLTEDDLVQAGNIGLCRAADMWLAADKIRRGFGKSVKDESDSFVAELVAENKGWSFRTASKIWVRKMIDELIRKHKSVVSHTVRDFDELREGYLSGDSVVGSDGEGNELTLFGAMETEMSVLNEAEKELDSLKLISKQILSKLTGQERNIVFMSFGIDQDRPMGYREISKITGYSTAYISTLIRGAFKKITHASDEINLDTLNFIGMLACVEPSEFSEWRKVACEFKKK